MAAHTVQVPSASADDCYSSESPNYESDTVAALLAGRVATPCGESVMALNS